VTLEAEPVSPGEALSGKLTGKLINQYKIIYQAAKIFFTNQDMNNLHKKYILIQLFLYFKINKIKRTLNKFSYSIIGLCESRILLLEYSIEYLIEYSMDIGSTY